MKKILFITCVALFTLSSCTTDDEQLIESNSQLQLIEMTEETYLGGELQYSGKHEYTYGSNGFVSTLVGTDLLSGDIGYTKNYLYNSDNQITEITSVSESSTSNKLFTYENGLITECEYPSSNSSRIYSYNNENQMISIYSTQAQTIEAGTHLINYDTNNNMSNLTDYYGSVIYSYTYDVMNNPSTLLFPSAYLKKGPISEHNRITKSGQDGSISKSYEYEYNSEGYPIKSTITLTGGYIQIREYVYN